MIKNCINCEKDFEIFDRDLQFYDKASTVVSGKKFQLPAPTLCPRCRQQRRLAFRNERALYKGLCDLCKKEIVSVFHENSPYTVYCYECWYGDQWDPLSYGMEYDLNRSFFEQYRALEKSFPYFALFQDQTSENCEYINYGMHNKSCYLMLGVYCEDVYYSHSMLQAKSSMDCRKCMSCELCYECVDCYNCYNLFFSQDCHECSDSYFLKNCRQSSNCFASSGLRNAKFVFENKQLTEEEYKKRFAEIIFSHKNIQQWKDRRDQISLSVPKKYMHGINNENVTGNYIDNSKNLLNCYDCFNLEDCAYCDSCGLQSKDLYDCSYVGKACELCYEVNGASTFNRCKFVFYGNNLSDSEYCKYSSSSANLFGCIGLRHKKYCILNKQYSQEEYKKLVHQIIEKMIQDKEYGEFFSIQDSLFAYNETAVHEYYPLTKEQALAKNYRWKDEENTNRVAQSYQVPDLIQDVPETILKEILACTQCGRNFKVIAQELKLYRKWNLPIPEKCPECRHKNRFAQRNPRELWSRECMKCNAFLQTSYAPNRPEIIYCEDCYLKEIY